MSRPTSNDLKPSEPLASLFDAVAREPTSWEFFALVRAVEQARPDLPRVGTSLDPAREAIDLAHQPSADFPHSTVMEFVTGSGRPTARSAFLGLTGPMGPLPFHLTELAIFERRVKGPTPFGDFLDLISARMLQSFYRAWSESHPCAQADRPADDKFAGYLGASSGGASLRFISTADRPPHSDEEFDDWRRLTYGGHYAALRSASAAADLLTHLLERRVSVTEAVGRWRAIPADARTRLGSRRGAYNVLGQGATLGRRFFAVEWNVRFHVPAQSMSDLESFLPGGHGHRLLTQAATSILPRHLDWEAQIEIEEANIVPARLGGTRLGMTSWIATKGRPQVRRDLRLSVGTTARQAA